MLLDLLDPQRPTVVAVGDTVKAGVPWRSVVRHNRAEILSAVRQCRNLKTPVEVALPGSRSLSAVPVVETTHDTVHGVWICIRSSVKVQPASTHPPTWAFLWDLEHSVSVRSEAVGTDLRWSDIDEPTRQPIAGLLRTVELEQANTLALSVLTRRAETVHRQTVNYHRPDGDRRVHFVAHLRTDHSEEPARYLRGISIDLGAAQPAQSQPSYLGDRVAEALTPGRHYRAIADPHSLNLLYWHGPPPPRLAWQLDNSAHASLLHADDMPSARSSARSLQANGPGRTVSMTARFLTTDGHYEPIKMDMSLIDLDNQARALLVVLLVE